MIATPNTSSASKTKTYIFFCPQNSQNQSIEQKGNKEKKGEKRGLFEIIKIRNSITFSNFSKLSALRGTHPWIASPATAESQDGQPAATCSPSIYLCKFLNRKLRELVKLELPLPDSPDSILSPSSFGSGPPLPVRHRRDDEAKTALESWRSNAGVTETAFLEATQPISGGGEDHPGKEEIGEKGGGI